MSLRGVEDMGLWLSAVFTPLMAFESPGFKVVTASSVLSLGLLHKQERLLELAVSRKYVLGSVIAERYCVKCCVVAVLCDIRPILDLLAVVPFNLVSCFKLLHCLPSRALLCCANQPLWPLHLKHLLAFPHHLCT